MGLSRQVQPPRFTLSAYSARYSARTAFLSIKTENMKLSITALLIAYIVCSNVVDGTIPEEEFTAVAGSVNVESPAEVTVVQDTVNSRRRRRRRRTLKVNSRRRFWFPAALLKENVAKLAQKLKALKLKLKHAKRPQVVKKDKKLAAQLVRQLQALSSKLKQAKSPRVVKKAAAAVELGRDIMTMGPQQKVVR